MKTLELGQSQTKLALAPKQGLMSEKLPTAALINMTINSA